MSGLAHFKLPIGDDGKAWPAFDTTTARAHLQFMFGGLDQIESYRGAWIEIGTGQGRARYFRLRDLDKAVAFAEAQTSSGHKIYVSTGLIRADYEKAVTQAGGHADAGAILCRPVLWGECDHKDLGLDPALKGEARTAARLQAFHAAAERHGLRWGWIQWTGTVPSLRIQGFIRLAEPAAPDDPNFWACVKALSRSGKLDLGATNSSQMLRLGGSVSWAGSTQKKDEIGEAMRIAEPVTRLLVKRPAPIALDTVVALLDVSGVLAWPTEKGSTSSTGGGSRPPPAKDVADLMTKVRPPADAKPLDLMDVREALRANGASLRARAGEGWHLATGRGHAARPPVRRLYLDHRFRGLGSVGRRRRRRPRHVDRAGLHPERWRRRQRVERPRRGSARAPDIGRDEAGERVAR